jgi:hypothetical protein
MPEAEPARPAASSRLRCFAVKEMDWLLGGQTPEHGRRKEDHNPTPTAFRLDFGHEEKECPFSTGVPRVITPSAHFGMIAPAAQVSGGHQRHIGNHHIASETT